MEQIYFDDFKSQEDIEQQFGIQITNEEILFAIYTENGDTGGQAFVLYRLGDELYEVNGWHCSCCGLFECWEPELTTLAALRFTLENGYKFHYSEMNAKQAFTDLLDRLES